MWYRFSKLKWDYDRSIGIDYSYAYTKADNEEEAIAKVNESNSERKYDDRGLDQIDNIISIPLEDIFNGTRKCNYTLPMLKKRMVLDGYAKEECYSCHWNEGRVTDGKIPLTIDFIDGESENKSLENMRLLCPNCYFVHNGFFHNSKKFVK